MILEIDPKFQTKKESHWSILSPFEISDLFLASQWTQSLRTLSRD